MNELHSEIQFLRERCRVLTEERDNARNDNVRSLRSCGRLQDEMDQARTDLGAERRMRESAEEAIKRVMALTERKEGMPVVGFAVIRRALAGEPTTPEQAKLDKVHDFASEANRKGYTMNPSAVLAILDES